MSLKFLVLIPMISFSSFVLSNGICELKFGELDESKGIHSEWVHGVSTSFDDNIKEDDYPICKNFCEINTSGDEKYNGYCFLNGELIEESPLKEAYEVTIQNSCLAYGSIEIIDFLHMLPIKEGYRVTSPLASRRFLAQDRQDCTASMENEFICSSVLTSCKVFYGLSDDNLPSTAYISMFVYRYPILLFIGFFAFLYFYKKYLRWRKS